MGRALSRDLRDGAVATVEGGLPCRQAAQRFGSVRRARSAGGNWCWLMACPQARLRGRDRRTAKIGDQAAVILEGIKRHADPTVAGVAGDTWRDQQQRHALALFCPAPDHMRE